MSACVVKPHHAGFWSNLNKIITCLRIYEHIHVDWSEGGLYGDCWNDLFEPTQKPTGEYDLVVDYPFMDMTAAQAGVLYERADQSWRAHFNTLWKRLKVRGEIEDEASRFFSGFSCRGTVSAIVRAHSHAGEQLSNRSQSLDEYAQEFGKLRDPDTKFFVMCGDEESLAWMQDRFPVVTHPATRRAATRDTDRHLSEKQTPADARQVLLEVLIASQCSALVHPVSNMATAALYINPSLKSIYLR